MRGSQSPLGQDLVGHTCGMGVGAWPLLPRATALNRKYCGCGYAQSLLPAMETDFNGQLQRAADLTGLGKGCPQCFFMALSSPTWAGWFSTHQEAAAASLSLSL